MEKTVYLDNAATTKPIRKAASLYQTYVKDAWYNPSALYAPSAEAMLELENTRKTVLSALGGYDGDVVFTSGGTESNNIAIFSAYSPKKINHYITSAYEHAAVYQVFKNLESLGQQVSYIKPNENGVVDEKDVLSEIKDNTVCVSIMQVNNETGGLNDINRIAGVVKAKKSDIMVHSDGVQGFLKVDYTISDNIDYYSISAHKIGGLKGCGALYIKKGNKIKPMMFGGGQEKQIRAGTENTFGIAVLNMAVKAFNVNNDKIIELKKKVIEGLCEIDDVVINSPKETALSSPFILNASILGIRGETLLHALEEKGIYIGIGSACSSKSRTNRVHDALGFSAKRGESAIRISFSHENGEEDVLRLNDAIKKEAENLRLFKRR